MNLQEVFDQLSYGEFSQLSIGGQPMGSINEGNIPRVLAYINPALTALYSRFHLKEGNITLQLQTGKTLYTLDSREDVRFVVARFEEEFSDDILKIEAVATSQGVDLALNDRSNPLSCHTPSSRVLRLPMDLTPASGSGAPESIQTDTLKIRYRANHPVLKASAALVPSRVDLELPNTHLMALLWNVASRVNNPIGMTNEFHAGNSYYAKYEAECQFLESQDYDVDQGEQNTRLRRNGWV